VIWRAAIVGSILGLWLAVGIAWGARAALLFAFPVFVACIFAVWAAFAGGMDQRAAGWYCERQLQVGRWRDRRRFTKPSS
jgi:hypothetical protein